MFITLLIFNFLVSFATCFVIMLIFRKPIENIFQRLVSEEIHVAWSRYILFAIFVVGISGGVRIWELERYINNNDAHNPALVLNAERWTLEIYRAIIGTLESNAWLLLMIFIFTLIAYVVVRTIENKKSNDFQTLYNMIEKSKKETGE
ncbi:MAG: hypothetical protein L6Q59_12500 [Ignavibacteriaceae bacterium]|nr:hypothetical protein [Ignavibacteriaceae bacterium]